MSEMALLKGLFMRIGDCGRLEKELEPTEQGDTALRWKKEPLPLLQGT